MCLDPSKSLLKVVNVCVIMKDGKFDEIFFPLADEAEFDVKMCPEQLSAYLCTCQMPKKDCKIVEGGSSQLL